MSREGIGQFSNGLPNEYQGMSLFAHMQNSIFLLQPLITKVSGKTGHTAIRSGNEAADLLINFPDCRYFSIVILVNFTRLFNRDYRSLCLDVNLT